MVALLERIDRLRETVRATAENQPGVYRMIAANGAVLYVGKSVHVRTRLLSYFRAVDGDKARRLMAKTQRVDWDYTPDAFGALLHEWRLIRRWRPPFNVEHKAETEFRFVKLTTETTPRLVVTRTVEDDSATYWGPFGAAARVRHAMRVLNGVVGVRDCSATTPMRFAEQGDLFSTPERNGGGTRADAALRLLPLCVRGEMEMCLAPCAGRCSTGEYAAAVDRARRFLEGKGYEPIMQLTGTMNDAAGRRQYELAGRLRDRLDLLHRLAEELALVRGALERLSFAYRLPAAQGGETVYLIRRGRVLGEFRLPADARSRRTAEVRMRDAARRLWAASAAAGRRIDSTMAGELLVMAGWFRRKPEELERCTPVERLV
jgi:excinuclease ABC subunit C